MAKSSGRLNELLDQVRSERNEGALPARVNRIYRCFEGTPAEPLVRALYRQAGKSGRSYFRSERCELIYRKSNFLDRGRDFVEVLFGSLCFGVRCVQRLGGLFIFG